MQYFQETRESRTEVTPKAENKMPASSEALQDLIDILKQNYVSDCPHCAGTGFTFSHRSCKPCMGLGKWKA